MAHLVGVFRRRGHICRRKCFLSGCAMLSGYIVRMFVFVINRGYCVRDCCGLDAINAFVNGKCRGADRSGGFGYGCIRFFTCLLVIRLGRAQNDGCVPRLSRVDPQLFFRCSKIPKISASSFGGSAPKNRSSAARSRNYSATIFIMSKEFSNPSNVHENVLKDTVNTLLELSVTIFAYLHIVRYCFIMPPLEKADRICVIQSIIS